jgi:nucleotide-binding universal stress UspA family protein
MSAPEEATAFRAIVCLDGSERAAEALGPAVEIAQARHGDVAVAALSDDGKRSLISEQLAAAGLAPDVVTEFTSRSHLLEHLESHARRGATPILSAFGRWGGSGKLLGLLGELVRAGIPRILTMGPKAADRPPLADAPILVSVDNVHRVDPLIDAVGDYLGESTPKIIITHVAPPSENSISYSTQRDASKFSRAFDIEVEAVAVPGNSVSETINRVALDNGVGLIIVRTWHRSPMQQPFTASNSLAIVVDAPCPVLIVN